MGGLIRGLLDLSRLGRAALKPERVDMAALARETFKQLSRDKGAGFDPRTARAPPSGSGCRSRSQS